MKNKLIFPLLFAVMFLQAQENYMSLSFGTGTPLGDFVKNESLTDHGFAKVGFMADYSGAYYPIKYLGIGASVKFNQFIPDRNTILERLVEVLPPGAGDEVSEFKMGFWSDVSFGIGPQFTLPVSIFNIDVFAFPGLHIVAPPELKLTAEINDEPYFTRVTSQNVRFGFEVGASLRINLGQTAGLRVFVSYLQTSSKGEIIGEDGGRAESTQVDFSKTISVLNTGVGLVYLL